MVALGLGGCILRAGGGDADPADGSPLDAADDDDAPPPLGRFGEPILVAVSDPMAADDDPSMTADLRELYFDSDRPGSVGLGDLFLASRADPGDDFGLPDLVDELASPDDDTAFRVADDGLALVFSSDRAGGLGGRDNWISVRLLRSDPWGEPRPLTELNSAMEEAGASLDDGGRRIVFSSDRDGAGSDLYVATRASVEDPFGPAMPIVELNTAALEGNPTLRHGGLTLYLVSNRDGTDDLYVTTRTALDRPFGDPRPLVELNSPSSDVDLWISEDERCVLFSSDRTGNSEIYEATR